MYACWAQGALLCWRSSMHEQLCRPRASLKPCKQHFSRCCSLAAPVTQLGIVVVLLVVSVPYAASMFAPSRDHIIRMHPRIRLPVVSFSLLSLCVAMCRKTMECKCKPCSRSLAPSAPSSRFPYLLPSLDAADATPLGLCTVRPKTFGNVAPLNLSQCPASAGSPAAPCISTTSTCRTV